MSSTRSSARSRASFGQPLGFAPERIVRAYGKAGDVITPREKQVLELVAAGLTNVQVAARLFISEETVKSHVRHVLAKLGARTRTHAVAIAFKAEIIELEHVELPPPATVLAQRRQKEKARRGEERAAVEAVAEEIRQSRVVEEAKEEGFSLRRFFARMWGRPTKED